MTLSNSKWLRNSLVLLYVLLAVSLTAVAQLCLESPKSFLDRVSTGSGSDLVSDQHAIIFNDLLAHRFDQVATAPCTDPIQVRFLLLRQSPAAQEQRALKDVFKNDFKIGAALNRRQIFEEDARGAEIVKTQFNSITPENILKWALVHPEPTRYDFTASDRFVELGEKHGMFIVGHTLVWHNQTPPWVFENADRATLLQRLRDHIYTVIGRYKGRINGWDVVNEALNQDGTMRQSPWLKIIGEDYLELAFKFAHEADPSAELYYNDYDLELPAKRAGAVKLIAKLKAAGVPISGVGLQNHNLMDWPTPADEDATITAFSRLGLKVNITELDVDVLPRTTKPGADYAVDIPVTPQLNPYVDRLPDAIQATLARRYAELFRIYVKHRDAIDRVTFWGVSDGDSWLNNWPMKGRTNYPLLFDRKGEAKPAFKAVVNSATNYSNHN